MMNSAVKFLSVSAMLSASSAAFAGPHVSVNIDPFGWGAPPPVVFESPRYYAPPPVVYYGGGRWGDHRDRDRGHDRGRDHDGDHRR
jgi:hypothetical protein